MTLLCANEPDRPVDTLLVEQFIIINTKLCFQIFCTLTKRAESGEEAREAIRQAKLTQEDAKIL